jgi:hypothetical protein
MPDLYVRGHSLFEHIFVNKHGQVRRCPEKESPGAGKRWQPDQGKFLSGKATVFTAVFMQT